VIHSDSLWSIKLRTAKRENDMNNETYGRFEREYNTRACKAGEGYGLGDDGDDINAIQGVGTLIVRSASSDKIAIYQDGDKVVLVGDANGPWAVDSADNGGGRNPYGSYEESCRLFALHGNPMDEDRDFDLGRESEFKMNERATAQRCPGWRCGGWSLSSFDTWVRCYCGKGTQENHPENID
jgi:hypothetical protein